jgi:putative ABC transport system ATP-binding protein
MITHAFTLKDVVYKHVIKIDQLVIPNNQTTSIIGGSGTGKTTLLKLLNQLISHDSGNIYFYDKPIHEWNPIQLRRKVVMLGQKPIIFPGNVRDNLLIGRVFAEQEMVDDQKLLEALSAVHLEKELEEDPQSFSGGEKQRLALARVLLMNPQVYLLDEPTSALDEDTAEKVINNFIQLAMDQKKTIVMVTHSKEIAKTYSNLIIHLSKENGVKISYEDRH